MKYSNQELAAFIHTERGEAPSERCQLLEPQHVITVEDAMKVLAELGVLERRSPRELDEDASQIITDAQVIAEFSTRGGDSERTREVRHWAYFKVRKHALKFSTFIVNAGYASVVLERSSGSREVRVRFAHEDCLKLKNIAGHTVRLRRLTRDLKGSYGGWETTFSVDELNATRVATLPAALAD